MCMVSVCWIVPRARDGSGSARGEQSWGRDGAYLDIYIFRYNLDNIRMFDIWKDEGGDRGLTSYKRTTLGRK